MKKYTYLKKPAHRVCGVKSCAPCLSPYTLVPRYLHRVCGVKSFTVFVSLSAPCLSPCLHRVCGALAYLTYYYIHSLLFLSSKTSKSAKCQIEK